MNWLNLFLLVMAVFRLTYLICYEDAPFDLAIRLRTWVFNKFSDDHWLNRGINCPYCVSFWVSLIALFVWLNPLAWLGTAGAVTLIFLAIELRGSNG